MRNWVEAIWLAWAVAATAFATFMGVFAIIALGYWTLGLLGVA